MDRALRRSMRSVCGSAAILIIEGGALDPPPSLIAAACDRDREDSPFVDFHGDLLEPRGAHQFVHLRGGPSSHDPRFTFAIAENARNEFNLRMPGLVGINEITARFDRVR